jgi:LysR family transcriptional regulator, carnitine catabolism transcriptional activator
MNLTFRQFEILIAAAASESFSAAAQRLGISQPSLSESIRRIEREIGARLFERTTRSLKLTDEGRSATAVAREAVRDFKRALDRLSARTGERQGRITIAALPSVACAALPAAIEEFQRQHPAIRVVLHDVQHERALALVNEGIADLAVTIKPATHDDLVFEEIASDVAHLVCRRDDPLAGRKQVRWRDLGGRSFIGITRISSVRRLTDAAFVHAEIAIEPRYEVEQIPSAVALVEAGLGVTALPSLTFSMFRGRNLAARPLFEPRLRRNVGFVTLAARTLPNGADVLMRAIRRTLLRQLRARDLRA